MELDERQSTVRNVYTGSHEEFREALGIPPDEELARVDIGFSEVRVYTWPRRVKAKEAAPGDNGGRHRALLTDSRFQETGQ